MTRAAPAVAVAVFAPLRRTFDYLPPPGAAEAPAPGALVRVPFGRGERYGVVVGRSGGAADDGPVLKPIREAVEPTPLLSPAELDLALWAADYYQHPLGEVIAATLPTGVRRGARPSPRTSFEWSLTPAGRDVLAAGPGRAPRQACVLEALASRPCRERDFAGLDFDWRRAMRELERKGLAARTAAQPGHAPATSAPLLNPRQREAVDTIIASFGRYGAYLLHGVTGSGKTEVYMGVIAEALARDGTALLLVPEIALTQQMVERLGARFGDAVGVFHSGLTAAERADVWQRCRDGQVGVLMGTRSAVWTPLPDLAVVIVDEEHDGSLKQQDGFRYNARDVAIVRASKTRIPVVLGSATPSLEAFHNVSNGKFTRLSLPHRAGSAEAPAMRCIDVRGLTLDGGLSDALCDAITSRLDRGEQSLLFLNRRGFAPVVLCRECGWIASCMRCDANFVWHKGRDVLVCHHCGGHRRLQDLPPCCPGALRVPFGLGTERIEETLTTRFPTARIARIDRDSMRGRGTLEATFTAIARGEIDILIGTQMLAKGHDFPKVTLVGVVDADSQLFSTDFRAEEKLAQTIVQVAGRSGRASIPGEVLIQTHHPHHALLRVLTESGYERFAERALEERRAAALPPYAPMAVVRAEAQNADAPLAFLGALVGAVPSGSTDGVDVLGPVPAAMERKAGRYRAQVMVTAGTRARLARFVRALIAAADTLPDKRRVRWSVDIDPHDV